MDDNEIDRISTLLKVKQYPFLNVVGIYSSAEDALANWKDTLPEVLLLDIDMPGISGMDMRRKLGNNEVCIFITSFPDYALDSFDLAALDFLVKPLEKGRFDKTMARLKDYLDIKHKAELFECSLGGDSVYIKDGHDQIKIQLHEILYLEALKDYTRIVTDKKKYCVLSMLGNLLQEHAFQTFIRIHRSYAVQKHFISKLTAKEVFVNDVALPIGRSYKDSVESVIAGR